MFSVSRQVMNVKSMGGGDRDFKMVSKAYGFTEIISLVYLRHPIFESALP